MQYGYAMPMSMAYSVRTHARNLEESFQKPYSLQNFRVRLGAGCDSLHTRCLRPLGDNSEGELNEYFRSTSSNVGCTVALASSRLRNLPVVGRPSLASNTNSMNDHNQGLPMSL